MPFDKIHPHQTTVFPAWRVLVLVLGVVVVVVGGRPFRYCSFPRFPFQFPDYYPARARRGTLLANQVTSYRSRYQASWFVPSKASVKAAVAFSFPFLFFSHWGEGASPICMGGGFNGTPFPLESMGEYR
jgi:hypothetical protein